MGLGNNRPKTTNVSTINPQQQQLLDLFTSGAAGQLPDALQALASQLNPQKGAQFFEQNIAAPQREQFFKTTIPGIQQAGANLGAKGGSTIERQLAQAAGGLERDLSRQLSTFQQQGQQQGLQNLMQFAGQGLKPGFQPIFQPGTPGLGDQALAGLVQALPFILAAL